MPIGSTTANGARINFDGILKTSNADQRAIQHRAYVQLYRNGFIEAVGSTLMAENWGGTILNLDDRLIYEIMRSLNDLAAVAVEPPYALLVSLIGVTNARFKFARGDSQRYDDPSIPLDRDQYHFDEAVLETIPLDQAGCASAIRPILDQIANAGGNAVSPFFDAQGHYIPPTRSR